MMNRIDGVSNVKGMAALDRAPSTGGSGPQSLPPIPRIPISEILRAVCDTFNVTQIEIMSSRRKAEWVCARHVCYWLCRELTPASYPQIGRTFDRDHSSIMYGIGRVDERIREGTPYGLIALDLKAKLQATVQ
jgi:chromosomal replication initiation ATPase DnaA